MVQLAKNSTLGTGGFNEEGRQTKDYHVRGAIPTKTTRPVTLESGNVCKARTWVVQGDTPGTVKPCPPIVESAKTTFTGAVDSGETIIGGGLTFTATEDMTIADVVSAFVAGSSSKATVSGTATFTFRADETGEILYADSLTVNSDVTNFAITGTSTTPATGATQLVPTTTIVTPSGTLPVVYGFLVMDVDASSANQDTQIVISGNYWDDSLNWGVDVAVDTIVNHEGTTVACTAYNTGCWTPTTRQRLVAATAGGTNFQTGTFLDSEVEA